MCSTVGAITVLVVNHQRRNGVFGRDNGQLRQVKSSTISIVVTDSTGARVPNVATEVLEEATNLKFEGRTNNVGELTVPT